MNKLIFIIVAFVALFVNAYAEKVYRIVEVEDESGNKNWFPILVDDDTWKK